MSLQSTIVGLHFIIYALSSTFSAHVSLYREIERPSDWPPSDRLSLSLCVAFCQSAAFSLFLSLFLCPGFETKDDYYFTVVNVNNDAILLIILQLTSAFCAQVGGPKAAPFEPLDFLQVGGPFREVGGPRPTLALW